MSYIQDLVAHYLRDNGLTNTLNSFELELNHKFGTHDLDESLETIVKDRVNFDRLEQTQPGTDSTYTEQQRQLIASHHLNVPGWDVLVPKTKQKLSIMGGTLAIATQYGRIHTDKEINVALLSASDRSLYIYDLDSDQLLLTDRSLHNGVSIKAMVAVPDTDRLITCGMDGLLTLSIIGSSALTPLVQGVRLHKRLITAVAYDPKSRCLGSVGWDSRLCVSQLNPDASNIDVIDDCKLLTKPTCILSIPDESGLPVFLLGRTDSSLLGVFTVSDSHLIEVARLSLNDSEFSNHSFHPMDIVQISDHLVCIATNHVPYLRLITLYIPPLVELIKQNKFYVADLDLPAQLGKIADAASHTEQQLYQPNTPVVREVIVSNLNSLAPQDKYSSPILQPRPQKQGLWIFGDDGKARGFDLDKAETVEELQVNEGRVKAAIVGVATGGKELILSCGAMDHAVTEWI